MGANLLGIPSESNRIASLRNRDKNGIIETITPPGCGAGSGIGYCHPESEG